MHLNRVWKFFPGKLKWMTTVTNRPRGHGGFGAEFSQRSLGCLKLWHCSEINFPHIHTCSLVACINCNFIHQLADRWRCFKTGLFVKVVGTSGMQNDANGTPFQMKIFLLAAERSRVTQWLLIYELCLPLLGRPWCAQSLYGPGLVGWKRWTRKQSYLRICFAIRNRMGLWLNSVPVSGLEWPGEAAETENPGAVVIQWQIRLESPRNGK